MNNFRRALFAALSLCAVSVAIAAPKLDPALQATTKEKFDDQAAAIRQQMNAGGHWEFVDSVGRSTIERRLNEISNLLVGFDSADALPRDKKAELVSAQEEVNAILTKNDGRRLICEKTAPTGSHRLQQQCQTFEQRERQRIESQKYMRDRATHRNGV